MDWDYFISHASEDKSLIVTPFAHYLRAAEFEVWYDDFSLKVGDSLLESISLGLRKSKYAVVFLSPAFFAKRWPQQELAGLYALESTGSKKILPVWHDVTATQVAEYSPILADRKAADTRKGLQYVAEQIVGASFPERIAGLPLSSVAKTDQSDAKKAQAVLRDLLASKPSVRDVRLYISGYPILLQNIVGYAPELIPGFKLPGPISCDFAELVPHGVTGQVEVLFVILGPVEYDENFVNRFLNETARELGAKAELACHPANDYLGSPYFGEFTAMAEMAVGIQKLVQSHNIHWEDPATWSFQFKIITGRRSYRPRQKSTAAATESGLRIDIASYDRLLDDRESIYGH